MTQIMHEQLGMWASPLETLASGAAMLVSWWKPLIIFLPFIPWALLVSKVFDKHAARFFLPREQWNTGHMCAAMLALAAGLLIPIAEPWGFIINFFAVLFILLADVIAFVVVTNKDERVPEKFRLKIDLSKLGGDKAAKEAAKMQGTVELVIRQPDKSPLAAPNKDTPEFALRVAAETLFIKAMGNRATQIDLGPTGKENQYAASVIVDGVRQPGEAMPGADAIKVIDFWKTAGKLDVNDRRRKLTADIAVEKGADRKSVRILTSGTQQGMRLTLLMDPQTAVRKKIEDLGLLESQANDLQAITKDEKGVVLLAMPPDNGLTTLMYSVLKQHDAYTRNIQTIELDVQDSLEGIRQNKFDAQAEGPEFSTLVRSIVRRDPNIVGVAGAPDANTAKEIAKSDVERVRIYLALPIDGAINAVQQYVRMVGDIEIAAKSLRGVISGKLTRKLCMECRQGYAPQADLLKKLGLPADKIKQLFKKGGQVLIKNKPEICPVCKGGGYYGAMGVYEIYPIEKAEQDKIRAQDWTGLKAEWRKRQLPSVQQAALRRAVEGITSVEEVLRVTAEGKAEGQPAAAASGGAPPAPGGPAAKPAAKT
jgi:type II secretory ATPase GspE/PulE/Tfp pilus assembly ATPase PilB-like protein